MPEMCIMIALKIYIPEFKISMTKIQINHTNSDTP